jgi:hypothetical protein
MAGDMHGIVMERTIDMKGLSILGRIGAVGTTVQKQVTQRRVIKAICVELVHDRMYGMILLERA